MSGRLGVGVVVFVIGGAGLGATGGCSPGILGGGDEADSGAPADALFDARDDAPGAGADATGDDAAGADAAAAHADAAADAAAADAATADGGRADAAVAEVIAEDDFERSDVLNSMWYQEYSDNAWSAQISNAHARTGTRSLRMELRRSDPNINGSKRSEVTRIPNEATATEEHWYYFSIYLPEGGDEDYLLDGGSELIAQWHNVPDAGEQWTYPPLALHTWTQGRYRIQSCWDDNPLSTNATLEANGIFNYDFGDYRADRGRWVDWAFHLRWGWLVSQHPLLEVYKDGVLVLQRIDEPNMTNDDVGVYMKLGIYKWNWAQSPDLYSTIDRRVIYYDSVQVTN